MTYAKALGYILYQYLPQSVVEIYRLILNIHQNFSGAVHLPFIQFWNRLDKTGIMSLALAGINGNAFEILVP